jgi:hypothetical protein
MLAEDWLEMRRSAGMGLRVAPREVEILEEWAAHQPLVGRLWIVCSDVWGAERSDASLGLALQLLPIPAGVEVPELDTSAWESQLDGMVPPSISLTVLDPSIDPDPHVRGGVEIFRRTLAAGKQA